MTGYNGFSMSNNAVAAYDGGLVPASKIKGVPAVLVEQFCRYEEWHHSSKAYNRVKFYHTIKVKIVFGIPITDADKAELLESYGYAEEDFEPNPVAVEALKNHKTERKSDGVNYLNCRVEWLEWSGSLKRPTYEERAENGCTVVVKGQTATITLPSGQALIKRLSTRGFGFRQIKE